MAVVPSISASVPTEIQFPVARTFGDGWCFGNSTLGNERSKTKPMEFGGATSTGSGPTSRRALLKPKNSETLETFRHRFSWLLVEPPVETYDCPADSRGPQAFSLSISVSAQQDRLRFNLLSILLVALGGLGLSFGAYFTYARDALGSMNFLFAAACFTSVLVLWRRPHWHAYLSTFTLINVSCMAV